jgi:hypothetical protein
MAWQLIYTSSPRLLEAGRTGFGTVAKHRAIGSLLTGSLEGISQFARLAGYDPNRIIYTHRILQAGSTRFNVLSCLRDAGSDYTGRTNHIAQHLIATASEVAELIQHGVTPADILFGMDWKSCWEGDARYLEISDEVKLSSATPFSYNAWTSITGLADHSRLPWSAAAEKGCYLVVPASMDPRQIVGESLQQYPQRAWEITFTTHLEPNDALGDFKWICLPPDSPARAQVESSSRTTFNLSQPASLPAPPPIQRALVPLAIPVETLARPEKQLTFAPPPSGLDPASTWGMNMLGPSQAGLNMKGHDNATTRPKGSKGLLVLAALSLVMMLALGAALYIKKDKDKRALADWRTSCWEKVRQWKSDNLQFTESRKYLFEKFVKESYDPKLEPEQLPYFRDFETFFKSVATALGNGGSTPIELPPNSGPAQAELVELKKSAENWILASKKLQGMIKPWSTWDAVNENLNKEKKCWDDLKSHYNQPPEARAVFTKTFVSSLLELLQKTGQKLEDYDIAMEVLKGLPVPEDQRPKWLAHWETALKEKKNKGNLGLLDVDKMNRDNPPPWLKRELQSLSKTPEPNKNATGDPLSTKHDSPEGKLILSSKHPEPSSAPAITGPTHPIYVASIRDFSADELAKLPKLPMQEGMTLRVLPLGKVTQAPLRLEKLISGTMGGLVHFGKSRMVEKEESLAFEFGKLTQIPNELGNEKLNIQCRQGLRLQALTQNGKFLFELHIKTSETLIGELLNFDEVPQAKLKNMGDNKFDVIFNNWLKRIYFSEGDKLDYSIQFIGGLGNEQIYSLESNQPEKEIWHVTAKKLQNVHPDQIEIAKLEKDIIASGGIIEQKQRASEKLVYETSYKQKKLEDQQKLRDRAKNDVEDAKQQREYKEKRLEQIKTRIASTPTPTVKTGCYVLLVQGISGKDNEQTRLCIVELK